METDDEVTHVELPRARVGGLKKDPVEQLLRRISHDFSSLQLENERLSSANERLAASNDRLSATVEKLESGPDRIGAEERAEVLLAVAQRAARELRESTRSECELMIKKTRLRARKLDLELERDRARVRAEIDELWTVRRELRESMRISLHALLRAFVGERPEHGVDERHGAEAEAPGLAWTAGGRDG